MTSRLCVRYSMPLVLVLFCLGALAPAGVPSANAGDQATDAPVDRFGENDEKENPFGDNKPGLPAARVKKAIRLGTRWLMGRQNHNGSWGGVEGNTTYGGGAAQQGGSYTHPAGLTALSLLALLKCKVPLNHAQVKAGFAFLRKRHEIPGGSYECSVLLMALVATGNPRKESRGDTIRLKSTYRKWAQAVANQLVKIRKAEGWRYQVRGQRVATVGGEQDLSSTQLAALALFSARRATLRVKRSVWRDLIKFTLAQQEEDGPEIEYPLGGGKTRKVKARGFAYIRGMEHADEGAATGAMTAGALANLQIARHALSDDMSTDGLKTWREDPLSERVQTGIYEAIAWLHENWHATQNPKKTQRNVYHFYWLYSFERAMDLLGLELIGKRLWYIEMGRPLLENQFPQGHWNSQSAHNPSDVLDTCFALLYLRRSMRDAISNPQVTPGEANPKDER